jgi:hypothetical protein
MLFQKIVDLIDSDSSIDEPEDAEEFEDVSEPFNVEDDIFIDDVKSTKIERLSKYMLKYKKVVTFYRIYTYNVIL